MILHQLFTQFAALLQKNIFFYELIDLEQHVPFHHVFGLDGGISKLAKGL